MKNEKKTSSDVETSKFLSFVLRHKPEAIGLSLESDGWADIETLLRLAAEHGTPIVREDLLRVVDQSDKKRFTLSPDGLRIRAAQGHSTTQVDIAFTPVTPPEMLFHGTAQRFVESIRNKGLVAGDRQYVHLSHDAQTAETVGKRHGKAVVLTVRSGDMARDGLLFYRSDNGVWLTRDVPARYLDE